MKINSNLCFRCVFVPWNIMKDLQFLVGTKDVFFGSHSSWSNKKNQQIYGSIVGKIDR